MNVTLVPSNVNISLPGRCEHFIFRDVLFQGLEVYACQFEDNQAIRSVAVLFKRSWGTYLLSRR
jgi:hypothetical protein